MNQYKGTTKPIAQIGSELGVGSVLEGSVRKADSQLRITVQLIDVETEEHRWAQTYDRKLENVFAIQAEVAERTAGALKVELLKSEREALQERPTSNLAAYESYLRGIQAFRELIGAAGRREEVDREAEKYFEEAIQKDPQFSAVHSYLANHLLGVLAITRSAREVLPRARELVARALELNPNSSDAHTAAGNLAFQADRDWTRAEAEFQQAIALNPSSSTAHLWYGYLLWVLQRFDEAKKQDLAAIELDPLWLLPRIQLVMAHAFSGDLGGAITLLEKLDGSTATLPPSVTRSRTTMRSTGRADDALKLVEAWAGASDLETRANRATVLALLGRPEEGRALLAEWEAGRWPRYLALADVAGAYAFLGYTEKALALLERDCRDGDKVLWNAYQDPHFDPIRDDPRFVAMLRTMKLPTTLARPSRLAGVR